MANKKFCMTPREIDKLVSIFPYSQQQKYYDLVRYLAELGCIVDEIEVPDPTTGFYGDHIIYFLPDSDTKMEIETGLLEDLFEDGFNDLESVINDSQPYE